MKSRTRAAALLAGVAMCAFIAPSPALARDLSFDERMQAREAVLRLTYGHVLGADRPFEQAFPRGAIARQVREILDRSAAWEARHGETVTRDMLRDEWRRIERSTRFPERLEEIRQALGNDPLLLEESVARPALLERLEALERSGGGEPASVGGASESPEQTGTNDSCVPDSWAPIASLGAPTPRSRHSAVWTGVEMIVWGGYSSASGYLGDGRRYDPLLDVWRPMSSAGSPSGRISHTALWTGSAMVVWGGITPPAPFDTQTGGRYDPIADQWLPTSLVNAPSARQLHTAVWTGNRMIVWGGNADPPQGCREGRRDGRIYDPVADTWTSMSEPLFLLDRQDHAAVWTGSEMVVWGGMRETPNGSSCLLNGVGDGARYDPVTDSWQPTASSGAPQNIPLGNESVWTGARMMISASAHFSLYDPAGDTWEPVNRMGEPAVGSLVWTGAQAISWGGVFGNFLNTGATWLESANNWAPTTTSGAPAGRGLHSAVWAGSVMIVWGGSITTSTETGDGASYSPGNPDGDGDGVCRLTDNCTSLSNPGQANADSDSHGDACDNCPGIPNPDQGDPDSDGSGNACDPCPFDASNDPDADSLCVNEDNCDFVFNPVQRDSDGDHVGDLCDLCPNSTTLGDTDGDGRGNACDCQPNDGTDRPPADPVLSGTRSSPGVATFSWTTVVGADRYSVTRTTRTALSLGDLGPCQAANLDQTTWSDAASPPAGESWYYLVRAQNFECGFGTLGTDSQELQRVNSNPQACVPVTYTDNVAISEATVFGTRSGSYLDTISSNNVKESITEILSGGAPPKRYSLLEHRWTIPAGPGSRHELHVEGDRSGDEDDFRFEWSTDGGATFTPVSMATLPYTSVSDDVDRGGPMPGTITGNVIVRVVDTNHAEGTQLLDTVHIDTLWIRAVP